MSLEEYTKEKLWPILVETVHAMVMYAHHKAYTREVILHEKPDITPQELASRLGIPMGEALVILYELKKETKV
jgi:ribosomal protein S25